MVVIKKPDLWIFLWIFKQCITPTGQFNLMKACATLKGKVLRRLTFFFPHVFVLTPYTLTTILRWKHRRFPPDMPCIIEHPQLPSLFNVPSCVHFSLTTWSSRWCLTSPWGCKSSSAIASRDDFRCGGKTLSWAAETNVFYFNRSFIDFRKNFDGKHCCRVRLPLERERRKQVRERYLEKSEFKIS